jgi:hypothetical protein
LLDDGTRTVSQAVAVGVNWRPERLRRPLRLVRGFFTFIESRATAW